MIETKKVTDRRTLSFKTMEDLWADVEAMDGKELRTTGNWSAAQIVEHVACVMTGAFDGTDIKASFPMRIMGRMIKGKALRETFKPGIKLPANMSAIIPRDDVSWEEATGKMRGYIERLRAGEKMTKPSPFFGPMTHEEWVNMHCRHAELHLGFIHTGA